MKLSQTCTWLTGCASPLVHFCHIFLSWLLQGELNAEVERELASYGIRPGAQRLTDEEFEAAMEELAARREEARAHLSSQDQLRLDYMRTITRHVDKARPAIPFPPLTVWDLRGAQHGHGDRANAKVQTRPAVRGGFLGELCRWHATWAKKQLRSMRHKKPWCCHLRGRSNQSVSLRHSCSCLLMKYMAGRVAGAGEKVEV